MELSILRIKSALASKVVRSTVIRCAFYHNKSWDLESEELDEYSSGRPSYSERRPDRRSNFSDRNYNDRRYSDNRGFRDSRSSFAGGTLSKVDWSAVNLTPWNKDLYTPSENILQLRPEDVEEYRKKHNMSVKGTDIPYPIQSFEDYNFPNEVQRMIRESGFQAPTPIQAQGWPIALSGRDFIGIGETGSGKTLGYTMPGLVHIRNQAPPNENDGPIGLVMAPTRELVQQINEVAFQTFGRDRNAIACLFGGASKNIQARQLYRKPSLCIATPGRLLDFLEMGVTNLRRCTYLVLDEADRMLDMGFEPQIRKIVDQIRPDRQTLMWSATWPKEVQALAQDYLDDYIQLNVGSLDLVANPNITQSLKMCNPFEKNDVFIQLMREEMENGANKILVFCQTKSQVDFIARRLYKEGIRARGLHGDHSQASRDNTLHEFRIGRTHVLVATDVASRGLDVNDISLVVNYDVPNDIESYIHRIGRTGRAGKEGRALSLLTEKDADIAKELIRVLKEAKQEIPEDLYELMEIGSSMRRSKKKYGGGYRQRSYQYSGNRRQY